MIWYSHLLKNFPQFVLIHTIKGFGLVNEAEVNVFLELSCFCLFDDPTDVCKCDLWFLCLFEIQLEHLEVHGSHTVKAWLGEF